jgi:hypothetical protein
MKFAMIATLFCLLPLASGAQMNGTQILHDCTSLTTPGVHTELESINSGHCIGMVRGVMETLIVWETTDTKHVGDAYHGCIPPEVGVSQAVAVVKKYLNDHPEKLHLGDSVLVRVALVEGFPCRRSPPV